MRATLAESASSEFVASMLAVTGIDSPVRILLSIFSPLVSTTRRSAPIFPPILISMTSPLTRVETSTWDFFPSRITFVKCGMRLVMDFMILVLDQSCFFFFFFLKE